MTKEYRKIEVKTWYLKFGKPIPELPNNVNVSEWKDIDLNEYLKLYSSVGEKWGWTGRVLKSFDELKSILEAESNEVWLFKSNGVVKGFFEIDFIEKGKAEIVYLGLLPTEIGNGYGKAILNSAINIAGRNGNDVWLHTCEYDHPNALSTYIKAGFSVISESIDKEFYSIEFLKQNKIPY